MRKYANIALVVGIIMIIYALVTFSLNQIWGWASTVSLVLGILLAAVGIYFRIQTRQKEFQRRTLVSGVQVGVSVLILLGILVLLAFITSRHHARADLTAKGLYSLAEQTKSVLNNLEKDVQIYAFYNQTDQPMAEDLLDEYSYRSDHVNFEFIDPNKKPQIARQYNVTQYNTIIVESGSKRETVNELSESNLTNALIKVTRELDKVVYFTTGHGERNIEEEGPKGFSFAAEGIRRENYKVNTLNLAQQKSIPEDCAVLIIAGPTSEFFPFELDSIRQYLENGGKLMALIDPQWKPAIVEFLSGYKIKVGNNIVVDGSGVGQLFGMGPEVPLVSQYQDHPIFQDFSAMTFYPLACSVESMQEGESGYTSEVLFRSSPGSWGEVDYTNRQVEFNQDRDLQGPVPLAVVSGKTLGTNEKSQLLVIGDSDFATNAYIRNAGNNDAFLNEINWLAEEEDMITIRPKEMEDSRVSLTARDSKVVLYVSVIALPLLVIGAAVFVYYRRR
ncbi:MAG: Gldg family protein [Calditrichia bacterium]